jgi:hypothetical protein
VRRSRYKIESELFLMIMEENAQELHYCKVSDFHVVGSGTYLAFRSRVLR